MSIPFSGTFTRSGGITSAIGKQVKLVNLKGVKRVLFTFDPFGENVKSVRDFLFYLSGPKITSTNPNCTLKTEIVCNRQPSEIKFQLIPSVQELAKIKEIKILSNNLTSLELLQLCNKHITPLAPKEDLTSTVKTKSERKRTVGGKK